MKQSKWKEFKFLLRREFLFQLDGRRAFARGVYPGVNWFALLCIGVLLLEFNSSRLAPESSSSVIDYFVLLTLGQVVLMAFRSTVYCALSFSRDLQNHTAAVLRVTPVSQTLAMVAKLVACLAPLWIEIALFLPVSILFFSVYLWLPPLLVASTAPFLIAISLLGGCLGLVVGSLTSQPQRAARNARSLVFLLCFIPAIQALRDSWFIPILVIGMWMAVATRRAPHKTPVLATLGTLAVSWLGLQIWAPSVLQATELHPFLFILDFYPQTVRAYAGIASNSSSFPAPLLASVAYLGLALVFFGLARLRYRHTW